jgi:serine/threonine-protein kinase
VITIMGSIEGLLGEKLGSFRIESILGAGAMGVVYRGTNEKTGRAAAVKVVSNEFIQRSKIGDRFEREAEILQQFRHPNIVRFLAWGKFRGTSYIAMEYVQGETLEKILQDRGPLPWREVADLGTQVCDALHYAHEHGVVHRDLKPSNLMVSTDGKIKLTDFGIAKDLDATALTATGRTLGTAAYMSPEQIRGTPAVSHKTDLYALGVVLYQMLVGKVPFEGNTPVVQMHHHLNEPPRRPSAKVAEIPKKMDELIITLMAKSPTDRPWDAAAVGASLKELLDKVESGAPVKMVWPAAGSEGANPPRAGSVPITVNTGGELTRRKAGKTGSSASTSRSTRARRLRPDSDVTFSWLSRSTLETALLASGLVLIGGFIAYWVWPPSAKYLYKQAEILMASPHRSDWKTARDEYLNPLDERFKNHPYKELTQKWRDRLLLEEAESRGRALSSKADIILTHPVDDAERSFIIAHDLASGAHNRGDDLTAIHQWREFDQQVKADDPAERKWHLLAVHRVEELENAITDRRQSVLKQLGLAETAFQSGRFDEAVTIRSKLVDEFSRFTDLADIFSATSAAPGSEPKGPAHAASADRTDADAASSPKSPPPKESSASDEPHDSPSRTSSGAKRDDDAPLSETTPEAAPDPSGFSEVVQHFTSEFRR